MMVGKSLLICLILAMLEWRSINKHREVMIDETDKRSDRM
jgi:hypothetical protein